jgi:hypothetical protein
MLLDGRSRIIAASDNNDILSPFPLETNGRQKGYYNSGNHLIAFAKTIGYEQYDGLGWYGVVVKKQAAN